MTIPAALVTLALFLAPIWFILRAKRRFGVSTAAMFAFFLYALPLVMGFAVMNTSTSGGLSPIGEGMSAALICSLVTLAGAALYLRFGRPSS